MGSGQKAHLIYNSAPVGVYAGNQRDRLTRPEPCATSADMLLCSARSRLVAVSVVPFSLTLYALIGVGVLEKTTQELQGNLALKLPILGVFGCLDDCTVINRNVLHPITVWFKDKVLQTVIPRNIALEEAHNQTSSIFEYQSNSKGAEAYNKLTDEILERVHHGR